MVTSNVKEQLQPVDDELDAELSDGEEDGASGNLAMLALGALGVVCGDIGTSPIYAFREALKVADQGSAFSNNMVFGLISLIFWSLILIVTVKYILITLRADNHGEGGALSLMSLVKAHTKRHPNALLTVGMCGAALFFGDAVLTPAMSVLSASEGIELILPAMKPYLMPLTLVFLVLLFSIQRYGTARISVFFGPVMALWFLVLGATGLWNIIQYPFILQAVNPWYAAHFLVSHSGVALVTMSAVFLAVTGAESLYADLGHFGRKSITLVWMWFVFPCLLLNYFGQAACVIVSPERAGMVFFRMVPEQLLIPLVLLSLCATLIASQAVITGAFSVARQAAQLNIWPRITIRHTSAEQAGQIYVPIVNLFMAVTVIMLVLLFQTSSHLAAAYGLAVISNMLVTSILLPVVMRRVWQWPWWRILPLVVIFWLIELTFMVANLTKIHEGGWASIAIATLLGILMWTWIRGSRILFRKTHNDEVPVDQVLPDLNDNTSQTVPGTAVFFTGNPDTMPVALLHSLKHYKVLHENNVLLTIQTTSSPRVEARQRIELEKLNDRFTKITLNFGYMQTPNVSIALKMCRRYNWNYEPMETSFFLSRRTLRLSDHSQLPAWQGRLFILMSRMATDATEYFQIPSGRVVEIGAQVNI